MKHKCCTIGTTLESHLSKELQKYYTRVGNRIIFSNGMTLNQLALEMWEKLGYKGVDASVLSRVLKGERLFTKEELKIFSAVLKLNYWEKNNLQLSLLLTLGNRYGIVRKILHDDFPAPYPESWNKMLDDYYSSLISADQDGKEAFVYYQKQKDRFLKTEFSNVLIEAQSFEQYLYHHHLLSEKRGKIWAFILSSLRADIMTHLSPPEKLSADPFWGDREISKLSRYSKVDPLAKAYAYASWASIMRNTAESLLSAKPRLAYNLITKALFLNREAELLFNSLDLRRLTFNIETMAMISDLETFYPNKNHRHVLEQFKSIDDHFTRILNEDSMLKANYSPCAYEFRARWILYNILSNQKKGVKTNRYLLFKNAMDFINKAENILKRSHGKYKVFQTNLSVTKVNLFRALGQAVPKQAMCSALQNVIESADIEQSNRLCYGT